jgi:hypothetical protein
MSSCIRKKIKNIQMVKVDRSKAERSGSAVLISD